MKKMKKCLLLAAIISSVAAYAAVKKCPHCNENFESPDGTPFCSKTSCVDAYTAGAKQLASQTRIALDRARFRERGRRDARIAAMRDCLTNAKARGTSVDQQLQVIMEAIAYPDSWHIFIEYADMEVIRQFWPLPTSHQGVFIISSAFEQYRLNETKDNDQPEISLRMYEWLIQSYAAKMHKMPFVSFALGRHQRTKEIRFVSSPRTSFCILDLAVKKRRADILEYLIGQMEGLSIREFCGFFGAFSKEQGALDSQRAEVQRQIAAKEEAKANAADKFQEERIQSEIDALQARLAQIPLAPENYSAVRDIIFQNTGDEVFQEFIRLVMAEYLQNNTATVEMVRRFISNDPRAKKLDEAIALYQQLGRLNWEAGLPNRMKVGLLAGEKEGEWVAAPGFTLQADGSAKWTAGMKHPEYDGLVSAEEIFTWIPDANHIWSRPNNPDDLTVEADGPAFVYILNSSQYR